MRWRSRPDWLILKSTGAGCRSPTSDFPYVARASAMEDEVTWLRSRIERYRHLLKTISDERAVGAIRQLIAEAEERLESLWEGEQ